MKKVIKADLDQFSHEDFNQHYGTLIDVGNVHPDHEHQLMGALGFLKGMQELVENLKKDLAAEPDGQNHTEKEEKLINENIELHREIRELRNKLIEYLQKDIDNKKEPRKMQVCK